MKFSRRVSAERAVMASGASCRLWFSCWPTTTMVASWSLGESAAIAPATGSPMMAKTHEILRVSVRSIDHPLEAPALRGHRTQFLVEPSLPMVPILALVLDSDNLLCGPTLRDWFRPLVRGEPLARGG